MSQLDVYGKCRIPYPEVDKIRCTPISESKHIVVIRNGHVRLKFEHITCMLYRKSGNFRVKKLSCDKFSCKKFS